MRRHLIHALAVCLLVVGCGGSAGWSDDLENTYQAVCTEVLDAIAAAEPSVAPVLGDSETLCACSLTLLEERYTEEEYLALSQPARDLIANGAIDLCLVDLGLVE